MIISRLIDLFLVKVGINPNDCCNSVDKAIEMKLPNCKRAEAYREQLKCIYYRDQEDTDTRIIPVEDDNFFDLQIHRDFAEEWIPVGEEFVANPNIPKAMGLILGILMDEFKTGPIELPPTRTGHHENAYNTRFVELIQNLAEKKGLNKKNLSNATLYRCINAGQESFRNNF